MSIVELKILINKYDYVMCCNSMWTNFSICCQMGKVWGARRCWKTYAKPWADFPDWIMNFATEVLSVFCIYHDWMISTKMWSMKNILMERPKIPASQEFLKYASKNEAAISHKFGWDFKLAHTTRWEHLSSLGGVVRKPIAWVSVSSTWIVFAKGRGF